MLFTALFTSFTALSTLLTALVMESNSEYTSLSPYTPLPVSLAVISLTDESNLYKHSLRGYTREYVTHSKGIWKQGNCHTNTIEGLWSVMKRGIYGIYHQVTAKHLQAYCNEYAFRYNNRNMKDSQRFILSLGSLHGRLTYKTLISEKESQSQDTRSNYRKNKPDSR